MSQINVNTIATAAGVEQARLVQVVFAEDGDVATGTTTIPNDTSIPQNTDGTECLTRTITPTNSSNNLLVQAICFISPPGGKYVAAAIFHDSVADALASSFSHAGTSEAECLVISHLMAAGTTSEKTFKLRFGASTSGTNTLNGVSSGGYYGGSLATSITISEIRV